MNPDDLKRSLSHFTGTETWWRHALNRNMLYTDGVKFFASNAEACWFLDIVATELLPVQWQHPFMRIELAVKDEKAKITVDNGDCLILFEKKIGYTDCPEGTWEFYLTDNVLLMPSEY